MLLDAWEHFALGKSLNSLDELKKQKLATHLKGTDGDWLIKRCTSLQSRLELDNLIKNLLNESDDQLLQSLKGFPELKDRVGAYTLLQREKFYEDFFQ